MGAKAGRCRGPGQAVLHSVIINFGESLHGQRMIERKSRSPLALFILINKMFSEQAQCKPDKTLLKFKRKTSGQSSDKSWQLPE